MKKETVIQLLCSAGAAIEAALSLLEEEDQEGQGQEKQCQHPKDRRDNLSTMGIERWKCKDCGHLHEEEVK